MKVMLFSQRHLIQIAKQIALQESDDRWLPLLWYHATALVFGQRFNSRAERKMNSILL